MHAWKCVTWGGPEKLEMGRMPDPDCGPGEVEIMVKACGVNFADLLMISGRYQLRPEQPFIPGVEVAGRVIRVGDEVDTVNVGDKAAAYVKYGAYADRVVAPVAQVAVLPDAVSTTDAAAFPVSYGSAQLAFERAALAPGEVVLIGGAGGAIGTACTELAVQRGATVIACVGDREKEDMARACGAEHVVSSHSRSLLQDITEIVADGVDVIIDPVGGNFFEDSLRALGFGGRVVVLGFASGKVTSLRLNHLLVRHQSIVGSSFGLSCIRDPEGVAARWPGLVELLAQGRIKPRVSRTLPFSDLPKALNLLKERKVAGRIVLSG
jgi:NADPH2:quinone reductase